MQTSLSLVDDQLLSISEIFQSISKHLAVLNLCPSGMKSANTILFRILENTITIANKFFI